MECPACGLPVEPGQATCPTCGAPIAGEAARHPAADIDPPTEVLPAVASSAAADDFDADTSSELPTTQVELPPAVDPLPAGEGPSSPAAAPAHEAPGPVGEPAAIERSAGGGSSSVAWRQLFVGVLVGGVVVLAFVIGAWAVGGGVTGLVRPATARSPAWLIDR